MLISKFLIVKKNVKEKQIGTSLDHNLAKQSF
jgi:hypothetical protein